MADESITVQALFEVYAAVTRSFETLGAGDVGLNLTYLLGAMLDRATGVEPEAWVDWSVSVVGQDGRRLWAVLRRELPANHPVFDCIKAAQPPPEPAARE